MAISSASTSFEVGNHHTGQQRHEYADDDFAAMHAKAEKDEKACQQCAEGAGQDAFIKKVRIQLAHAVHGHSHRAANYGCCSAVQRISAPKQGEAG